MVNDTVVEDGSLKLCHFMLTYIVMTKDAAIMNRRLLHINNMSCFTFLHYTHESRGHG